MTDEDALNVAAFLIEAGHLKRTPRAGWPIAGVRDPESVAEHSYRTAIIAYVLATMEGANAERAATLAVFHDVPEARSGDIPSTGKRYLRMAPAVDIAAEQTANLPTSLAESVRRLIGEFEGKVTPEAVCAKDADKLECLLQAREYQAQGFRLVQPATPSEQG
jgi:putative hydrolase of HD superfamily